MLISNRLLISGLMIVCLGLSACDGSDSTCVDGDQSTTDGDNEGCLKDADCKGDRICEEGLCVEPYGNQSDGDEPGDGDETIDGDEATDGDMTDGDALDADESDSDIDGDKADDDMTDSDVIDRDEPDGDADGDETDGNMTDGDVIDGDEPDGDADGDETDGDQDTDGDPDHDPNLGSISGKVRSRAAYIDHRYSVVVYSQAIDIASIPDEAPFAKAWITARDQLAYTIDYFIPNLPGGDYYLYYGVDSCKNDQDDEFRLWSEYPSNPLTIDLSGLKDLVDKDVDYRETVILCPGIGECPGNEGNESGVGRPCTLGGGECIEGTVCFKDVQIDGPEFCTVADCSGHANCGPDSMCAPIMEDNYCMPISCLETLDSFCKADEGNDVGVGKACSLGGGECPEGTICGLDTDLFLGAMCTIVDCASTAVCGTDAACPIPCEEWEHLKERVNQASDQPWLCKSLAFWVWGGALSLLITIQLAPENTFNGNYQLVPWFVFVFLLLLGCMFLIIAISHEKAQEVRIADILSQMTTMENRYVPSQKPHDTNESS